MKNSTRWLLLSSVLMITACGPSVNEIKMLTESCIKSGGISAYVFTSVHSGFACREKKGEVLGK